jgi:hypothetical protein
MIDNDPAGRQLTGLGATDLARTRMASTIGLRIASRPVSLFARRRRSAAAKRFANRYVMPRQVVTS